MSARLAKWSQFKQKYCMNRGSYSKKKIASINNNNNHNNGEPND